MIPLRGSLTLVCVFLFHPISKKLLKQRGGQRTLLLLGVPCFLFAGVGVVAPSCASRLSPTLNSKLKSIALPPKSKSICIPSSSLFCLQIGAHMRLSKSPSKHSQKRKLAYLPTLLAGLPHPNSRASSSPSTNSSPPKSKPSKSWNGFSSKLNPPSF